jgi:hypothetical protein
MDFVQFLESSCGALQEKQRADAWKWDAAASVSALQQLVDHRMIESGPNGRYTVSPLGRLAGESATEVESVIRVVDCLRGLTPPEITDPVLIVTSQATVELDAVPFPINRKSTQKEPQAWTGELQTQGVGWGTIGNLQRNVEDQVAGTLRAKRAVACLYYMTGMEMSEIERAMTRFGGGLDGAAGPIRSVASRTCDVLPMVARVAELLHPGLDLSDRASRLAVRLELGVRPDAVDLARQAGRELGRGDYRRLSAAGLTSADAIAGVDDVALLAQVGNDKTKVLTLKHFADFVRAHRAAELPVPALEPYQG